MIKTIRPKLELLSKRFIEKIIDEAYIVLDKQGIFVENKQALTALPRGRDESGSQDAQGPYQAFARRKMPGLHPFRHQDV